MPPDRATLAALAGLGLLALGAACAGARPPPPSYAFQEPEVVEASPDPDPLRLDGLSEAELAAVAADPGAPLRAGAAAFRLAEAARLRFEAAPVDPEGTAEEVGRRLDAKGDLLLAAQARYLEAMRPGDPGLALAAGEAVGGLYETFHRQLLEAPVPAALGPEQAEAYRAELREQVGVLSRKAAEAYQETLAAARRAGVGGPAVQRLEAALARLQPPTPPPAPAVN